MRYPWRAEFLDHAQAEDRTFGGMVEHVEPNQTRVQSAIGRGRFVL